MTFKYFLCTADHPRTAVTFDIYNSILYRSLFLFSADAPGHPLHLHKDERSPWYRLSTTTHLKKLNIWKFPKWANGSQGNPLPTNERAASSRCQSIIELFHFPEAGRRDDDVPISVASHTSDLDDEVQESRHGLNNLCMHRCELTIYIFDIL